MNAATFAGDTMGPNKGYITIKAIHVWAPFVLQLVVLIGGWFTLQQKVTDLQGYVQHLENEIVELRSHLYYR